MRSPVRKHKACVGEGVFLGAAEAAAREWAMHGRAGREQVHAVLKGTLLAMVGQVLPGVPPSRSAA